AVLSVAWKLVLLLIIIVLLVLRGRKLSTLRAEFFEKALDWQQRVTNASGKYVDFQFNQKDLVIGLGKSTGRTKAVFDRAAGAIDDIYIGTKAIEAHIARCEALAKRGNFFRLGPLKDALAQIDSSFEFDTAQVNKDLFGGDTVVVTVVPETFA